MDLTFDDVHRILAIVDAAPPGHLALDVAGLTLELTKRGEGVATSPAAPGDAPAPETFELRAPLLGIFRRAGDGAGSPLAHIGAVVTPDDDVGIIEVLGVANPIRLGRPGVIVDVLAEDGQLVEYGQPLVVAAPLATEEAAR